ncbi:MAG: FAD-binding oxidoreductase [Candidatus Glassbacteria bacterium]
MMDYGKIDEGILSRLSEIVGEGNLLVADKISEDYSHDEFSLHEIRKMPAVVVKPESTQAVSGILCFADEQRIPVTPRGGGTGLCGGCVPVFGGILLSLERMNAIEEVDSENMTITCQAGVRLTDLYAESEKSGLFFPPHPGDESAMVGGLIATNAGGARAVKYGVVRSFVREVEVVLAGGDVVRTGGKMLKNSSGYSLLHLLIGSEGTLGVITKATISLMAPPGVTQTLIAPFRSAREALGAVPHVMNRGIIPMALELLERKAITVLEKNLNLSWPCKEGDFFLMAINDGLNESEIDRKAGSIAEICSEHGALDILVADSSAKQREVLHMRSMMYESIKPYTVETLDISLPRSEMAGHVERVTQLSEEYDMWISTYGHAADGNLHSHITGARFESGSPVMLDENVWRTKYPELRDAIHDDARRRGGAISGEHGIGLVKKNYLSSFLGERQIELMRGIKSTFDPHSIMNPGKIFD